MKEQSIAKRGWMAVALVIAILVVIHKRTEAVPVVLIIDKVGTAGVSGKFVGCPCSGVVV